MIAEYRLSQVLETLSAPTAHAAVGEFVRMRWPHVPEWDWLAEADGTFRPRRSSVTYCVTPDRAGRWEFRFVRRG